MNPLPTKEAIQSMSFDDLKILEDDVDFRIQKIKADLEFCDIDNKEWYSRAKSALAYHQVCLKRVQAQLRKYDKVNRPHINKVAEQLTAKALKKEAEAKLKAENIKLKQVCIKEKELKKTAQIQGLIERTSYLHIFRKVAQELLSKEDFQMVDSKAMKILESHLKRELIQ